MYKSNGSGSVMVVLDWLLFYVDGSKVYEEFVYFCVFFDVKCCDVGLFGYFGLW